MTSLTFVYVHSKQRPFELFVAKKHDQSNEGEELCFGVFMNR